MNPEIGHVYISTACDIWPALEDMPQSRVRLNPDLLPALAVYLLTQKQQYEKTASLTLSGLAGVLRERRKGQVAWARAMCEAYDTIVRQLPDTVDSRALDGVIREWERGATESANGNR